MASTMRLRFQRLLAGCATGLLALGGMGAVAPTTPAQLQGDTPRSTAEVGPWLCAIFPALPGCHSK